MGYFRHIATSRTGEEAYVTGISDVVLRQTATGLQVYSASGRDGGIQVRNANLGVTDSEAYRTGGGLGAPAQLTLATLGGRDALLLAGWIHYLAFDLFVGSWEVSDSRAEGIHHLLVIPCLLLTFMAGPAGLAVYCLIKYGRRLVMKPATTPA